MGQEQPLGNIGIFKEVWTKIQKGSMLNLEHKGKARNYLKTSLPITPRKIIWKSLGQVSEEVLNEN